MISIRSLQLAARTCCAVALQFAVADLSACGESDRDAGSHAGPSGAQTNGAGSAGAGGSETPRGGGNGDAGNGDAGNGDAGNDRSGARLPGWTLLWSDEFDGPDGSAVDANHFRHDIGGEGWGNGELEYYTADLANAQQRAGNLEITATTDGAARYSCHGAPCRYTSARLLGSGLFSVSYGRVEARIQMPTGKGIWPAFWMLGENLDTVGWPACGEIDIMEAIGTDSAKNHGSLHGPGYSGDAPLTATYSLPGPGQLSDDFHVYSVEWAVNVVRFYVDEQLYETRTPSDLPSGTQWVYDHPFFIILNVAVGGAWPGNPDQTSVFPVHMRVDYVRVFRAS